MKIEVRCAIMLWGILFWGFISNIKCAALVASGVHHFMNRRLYEDPRLVGFENGMSADLFEESDYHLDSPSGVAEVYVDQKSDELAYYGDIGVDNDNAISKMLVKKVAPKAFFLEVQCRLPLQKDFLGRKARPPKELSAQMGFVFARDKRFVIPTTSKHNVESFTNKEGVKHTFESATALFPPPALIQFPEQPPLKCNFKDAGIEKTKADLITIREKTELRDICEWEFGYDVTYSPKEKVTSETIQNLESISFEKASSNLQLQPGMKIGVAIDRRFYPTADDADIPSSLKDEVNLKRNIYGQNANKMVYTGEILRVNSEYNYFEHTINTYMGCSGAIVFLLDRNQPDGVDEKDYGKAIAVHAGGFSTIKICGLEKNFNIAFMLKE